MKNYNNKTKIGSLLWMITLLTCTTPWDYLFAAYPVAPQDESACAAERSRQFEAHWNWHVGRLALIDLKEETDLDNCWAIYTQASEEAWLWYTFALQSATVAVDACLYKTGVALVNCLALAAAEPTPTGEALCGAVAAADFAVCWAAYYVAAEAAQLAYQSSMDTAVLFRNNCTEQATEYAAHRREVHNNVYMSTAEVIERDYADCIARLP